MEILERNEGVNGMNPDSVSSSRACLIPPSSAYPNSMPVFGVVNAFTPWLLTLRDLRTKSTSAGLDE